MELPLGLALVAGGLATVNPCGFPLLPAFLSVYVGAREERLPPVGSRVLQGLLVGALVTAGFLGVFVAVGLPVAYGASRVADVLPWAGVGLGGLLVAAGVLTLAGRGPRANVRWGARRGGPLLFGVGYGVASLGCTLPIFLAVVGAAAGSGSTLVVFAAYGAGMALVVTALAVAAALLRDGVARGLRRLLPHMGMISGLLLVAAGAYLAYYWYRIGFGPAADLADDPIVTFVTRFTAEVEQSAGARGWLLLAAAGAVVALAIGVTWRRASASDDARRGRRRRGGRLRRR
ncbi:MAG: cytochrome c biogenesis protein CcdA [Thermoleophilia bacterium]|nr:cytochrome c biogenesis protein CcdA [Thermoleophilia bacterium]